MCRVICKFYFVLSGKIAWTDRSYAFAKIHNSDTNAERERVGPVLISDKNEPRRRAIQNFTRKKKLDSEYSMPAPAFITPLPKDMYTKKTFLTLCLYASAIIGLLLIWVAFWKFASWILEDTTQHPDTVHLDGFIGSRV